MPEIECGFKMCKHNNYQKMETFGYCSKEGIRITSSFENKFLPICFSYNEKQVLCTYVFKGPFCGYKGTYTWCNGTLERCKDLGRHEKFTTTG